MTYLIYGMLLKIYCEMIGSYEDFAMYVLVGAVMWFGHCAIRYMFK